MVSEGGQKARNQLGTLVRTKSFLRGAQIFWIMFNNFTKVGEAPSAPPLVTGLVVSLEMC